MPAYVVPDSYTAGKRVTLDGTVYEPGDVVPNEVVRALSRLSSLLGNRTLIPHPDPHHRRTRPEVRTPSDVPAVVRPLLPANPVEEPPPEEP